MMLLGRTKVIFAVLISIVLDICLIRLMLEQGSGCRFMEVIGV